MLHLNDSPWAGNDSRHVDLGFYSSCRSLTLYSVSLLGAMTLCLTNPIWVTKTRLVLQYSADPSGKQYRGMMDALVKIYRHEGIAGLYRVRLFCEGFSGSMRDNEGLCCAAGGRIVSFNSGRFHTAPPGGALALGNQEHAREYLWLCFGCMLWGLFVCFI